VFVVKRRSWLLSKSGNDCCISSFHKSGASGGSILRVEAEPERKALAIYLRNPTSLQTLSIKSLSSVFFAIGQHSSSICSSSQMFTSNHFTGLLFDKTILQPVLLDRSNLYKQPAVQQSPTNHRFIKSLYERLYQAKQAA
jgi:hypothetical protein